MELAKRRDSLAAVAAYLLLAAAVWTAYRAGLDAPFTLDDAVNLKTNPFIRRLWPLSLDAAPGSTLQGRPVLKYSFALNYALGGLSPFNFRLVNLLIHALGVAVLFSAAKKTLLSRRLKASFGDVAGVTAFAIALLWAVHPLNTQAVTYISQRAESLAGLFYLLVICCLAASFDSRRPLLWLAASSLFSLLGMGAKEIAVTAPLAALLYDRAFFSGSFKDALRERPGYYLSLFAGWILLALLMAESGSRNGTVGFGAGGLGALDYFVTQQWALWRYIGLSFWPSDLALDYRGLAVGAGEAAPFIAASALLYAYCLWALLKNRPEGFPLIWFVLILSPTSTFVPIVPTLEEHRMYLPLIGIIALPASLAGSTASKLGPRGSRALAFTALAMAIALSLATAERNRDYREPLSLWEKNVRATPYNDYARIYYGNALLDEGRREEAAREYREAALLAPDSWRTSMNAADGLWQAGYAGESLSIFERAVALRPNEPEILQKYGVMLMQRGGEARAIELFERALALRPEDADLLTALGVASSRIGATQSTAGYFERAITADPFNADAYYNYGNFLMRSGNPVEAAAKYRRAVELDSSFAKGLANLGGALFAAGNASEGIEAYERALGLEPDNFLIHRYYAENLRGAAMEERAALHFKRAAELEKETGGDTPR